MVSKMKLILGEHINEAYAKWLTSTDRAMDDYQGFYAYLGDTVPVHFGPSHGTVKWLVDDEAAYRIKQLVDSPHWKTLVRAYYAKHGS